MEESPKQYTQLLVFVPEGRREPTEVPVELQDRWVRDLLRLCSKEFGGATAYGRGVGAWKDEQSGKIHWDRVTVVETWIDLALPRLKQKRDRLVRALKKMRKELRQKEVACIIDGEWMAYR